MSDTYKVNTVEGDHREGGGSYLVVASRFNSTIVEPLISGAIEALTDNGVPETSITLVRVPGAFELPLVAKHYASRGSYQAIIALGAVIRGDTPHFEYVAGECARGLNQVSLSTGVPVAFGVLTVDTMEQALARAAVRPDTSSASVKLKASGEQQANDKDSQPYEIGKSNKGYEAALTALEMASLMQKLSIRPLRNWPNKKT